MPDELNPGVEPTEVPNTEPEQSKTGTDAPGAETEGAEKEVTPNEPKTITLTDEELKDRIERATAKAAARAERRAFREAKELLTQFVPQQQAEKSGDGRPSREQFQDDESFIDALTDWKLDQRERGQKQVEQQRQVKTLAEKTEKIYAEAEKIPGFDRDDFDSLPLTPVIAQALTDSDVAPKLMAYMAQHPEEVSRIGALSPARQAVEVGKLEVKLTTTAKAPKAPAPIETVTGAAAGVKSLEKMNAEDYYRERMKQRPVWQRR